MKLQELFEARRKDLEYKNKVMKNVIERVTVELAGSESAVFTRAAKRYKQMDRLLESIQNKRNELNNQVKDKVLEYFDEGADEIYTRVIETVSMTATMSKKQADQEARTDKTVDYEGLVKKLLALVPEIEGKVKELTEEFTISTDVPFKPGKSPSLSVKIKDDVKEGVGDVWQSIKAKVMTFLKGLKVWGKDYDAKLAAIKKEMQVK